MHDSTICMIINAAIYVRTSVECPASVEEQSGALQGVADRLGLSVIRTFTDRPMPMKRGREQRPAEAALLNVIRAGKVSKVLIWSLDRVGRTLPELAMFLETCRLSGVDIYIYDMRLDSATGHGLSL